MFEPLLKWSNTSVYASNTDTLSNVTTTDG